MNILWLARHGLNEFEQLAIMGVVVVAIHQPPLCLVLARQGVGQR